VRKTFFWSLLAAGLAAQTPALGQADSAALRVIHARKSVRHFTGAAVSRDQLETILRAGMAAPTAVNKQPWSFVVVTGRAKLDSLAQGLPYAAMLRQAGAAIVVCALPGQAFHKQEAFAVIDCSLASENILLAAEALGLGALWTECYPEQEVMGFVRKRLGIPADVIPLNVIPVGQPAGEDKPKDKYRAEKIHWEAW